MRQCVERRIYTKLTAFTQRSNLSWSCSRVNNTGATLCIIALREVSLQTTVIFHIHREFMIPLEREDKFYITTIDYVVVNSERNRPRGLEC